MKINIGGGYKKYEGFVNLDCDPLTQPDYIINLEKDYLPFSDNSVDEVKAYHILEHIGEGFFHLMKELYRVCKDGAIIDIEVPHHRHENFYGDPSHVRPITVEMLKQFSKKYNQWHIDTYGSSSGFGLRLDVDFEILEFDYVIDVDYLEMAKAGEYQKIQMLAKQINNVFQDTKIKLGVVKK